MPQYVDEPPEVLLRIRAICARLPEVREDESVNGRRWRVRRRTFAWLWTRVDDDGVLTRLQFRSPDPEFGFLVAAGPPFEQAGWGRDVVNLFLDADTDWDEVAELVTESYCVLAPKRLARSVRPPAP